MAAYLIPATTALIALTLALLVYVVRVAKKRAVTEAQPAAANEMALRRRISSLGAAFRNSVSLIEVNLASRWRRYQIPWVMLVGESGSGKSVLIENAGMDRAFRTSSGAAVQHAAVGWHYFNRGVVLDVAGDYLGANASAGAGDRAWQALLRLTEKYRPKRPIDAAVITVSAAALMGSDPVAAEDAARQADLLHRRLWQAQSRFGIVFPVYVVITQCDRLEGFATFVRALPMALRSNMLGWSNPYDFESGYKSAMADQALEGVLRSAFELEAEIFASGRHVPDPDALVRFPAAIGSLRQGLRTYLDQLFRPSAYHETFFFRGVYLTGDAGFQAPAPARSAPGGADALPVVVPRDDLPAPGFETRRDPVFVRDIFDAKVFPEFGMARPSRDSLMSKNRTVRVLRWVTVAGAILWSCTLLLAAFQLDAKIDAYENALDLMVKSRKERQAAHERKENLPPEWYIQNTTLLLDKMAPLGGVRLWWFSIPGSWPAFTEIHDEIQKTLYGGFQDIVFNTVRKGLNVKVSDLTGIPRNPVTTELRDNSSCAAEALPPIPGSPAPTSLLIDDLQEFTQLSDYVRGATALHNSLATFERLKRGEAAMPDLRGLLRYTWNISLPESLDNSAYHTAAMRQGYKFDNYDPSVAFVISSVCSFNQRVEQVFAKFFTENPAITHAREIAKALTKSGDAQTESSLSVESYTELLAKIQALDALVKSGRAAWLQAGERELGAGFSDLMHKVAEVPVLGIKVRDEARATAQRHIDQLNKDLALVSAESVGAILRRPTDGAKWELSPDLVGLQASLGALLRQRFMTGGVEGRSLDTRIGPLTPVRWDLKRLDDAIALADEQRRYLKDSLSKFPPMLQSDIQELANWQLSRRVTDLLASAQIIQSEASVLGRDRAADAAADMQDFDRAGPRLVNLLTKLKDMGAESTYADLSALLKRDALRGLLAIDRSLNGVEAYTGREGGFSWWQGTKNPALGAFRVSDSQSLVEYLGQQYTQIEWLSSLSAPLISVVDSSGMRLDAGAARIVKRWKGINREVEKFKAKNPRSSVAELEAFIRADMAEVDGQNCIEKVGPKLGTARDPDFFQEKLIGIRQQLYARCYDLANAEVNKAYELIEDSFRRTLAGRFPFTTRTAASGVEAEADDIAQFLRIYDRNVKAAMPSQGAKVATGSVMAEARKFLEQIDKVRGFLGPVLPSDDPNAAAGYDLTVEFRVNQRAEVDGNKIVDWQFEVGDQALRLRDANRALRWRPGLPITLTLRWAKDAPTVPVNDGTQANLTVDGKNIVFRFSDPWSLISVLKQQATGPVDALSRSEIRPHTLRFEFPTQPASEGGQFRTNAALGKGRVFMRLSVSPNGKKDLLTLPVFPVSAPVIAPEKSGDASMRNGRTG